MTLTHGEPQVDRDPAETAEWLEALDAVVRNDGDDRARELLEALFADARRRGLHPGRGSLDAVREHDPQGARGADPG